MFIAIILSGFADPESMSKVVYNTCLRLICKADCNCCCFYQRRLEWNLPVMRDGIIGLACVLIAGSLDLRKEYPQGILNFII